MKSPKEEGKEETRDLALRAGARLAGASRVDLACKGEEGEGRSACRSRGEARRMMVYGGRLTELSERKRLREEAKKRGQRLRDLIGAERGDPP